MRQGLDAGDRRRSTIQQSRPPSSGSATTTYGMTTAIGMHCATDPGALPAARRHRAGRARRHRPRSWPTTRGRPVAMEPVLRMMRRGIVDPLDAGAALVGRPPRRREHPRLSRWPICERRRCPPRPSTSSPLGHPQQVNCCLPGDKCSCWSKLVEVLGLSLTDRGLIRRRGNTELRRRMVQRPPAKSCAGPTGDATPELVAFTSSEQSRQHPVLVQSLRPRHARAARPR